MAYIKNITSKFFETDKIYDTRELASNSKEFLNSTQKAFALKTKKTKRLFILIISHLFAVVLIVDSPQTFIKSFSHFLMDTIFYGLFTIVTLPIAWYHYFDDKAKLRITNEGILIEDKDLYYWGMITKTSIREVNDEGRKYYLVLNVVYRNAEPQEIITDITYLDKKPEDVAQIIERLKN